MHFLTLNKNNMKLIKIIIPTTMAYLFSSLIYNNFSFFVLNIGALWINVKYYVVIIFGLLLSLVIVYINKRQIINAYRFLFLFIGSITLVIGIDSTENLKYYSLVFFFLILFGIIIYLDFKERKLKKS